MVTPRPPGQGNTWSEAEGQGGEGSRGGGAGQFRDRRGETLFIDARKMGSMVDRTHRELTDQDLAKIAGTYHAWRGDPILPLYLRDKGTLGAKQRGRG